MSPSPEHAVAGLPHGCSLSVGKEKVLVSENRVKRKEKALRSEVSQDLTPCPKTRTPPADTNTNGNPFRDGKNKTEPGT